VWVCQEIEFMASQGEFIWLCAKLSPEYDKVLMLAKFGLRMGCTVCLGLRTFHERGSRQSR